MQKRIHDSSKHCKSVKKSIKKRKERQKQEQRIEMRLFVFMKSKCKSSALLCKTKCLLDFVRCPLYVIL